MSVYPNAGLPIGLLCSIHGTLTGISGLYPLGNVKVCTSTFENLSLVASRTVNVTIFPYFIAWAYWIVCFGFSTVKIVDKSTVCTANLLFSFVFPLVWYKWFPGFSSPFPWGPPLGKLQSSLFWNRWSPGFHLLFSWGPPPLDIVLWRQENAGIVQLVERLSCKQDAAGSSPAISLLTLAHSSVGRATGF